MAQIGCSLIVDVHGTSVSVTAFVPEPHADKKTEIIYSAHTPISLNNINDEKTRIHVISKTVRDACKKAFTEISKNRNGQYVVSESHIVYAPVWSSVQAIEINITREQPFLITERFISSLSAKDRTRLSGDGYVVVKTTYESLRLNGYPTDNPLGKITTQLSGDVHIILVNQLLSKEVRQSVAYSFGHSVIIEHALSELLSRHASQLAKVGERYMGYVFVDDDITSIAVVRDSFIQAEQSFPAGINKLHSDIFPNTDTAITLSLSKLSMDSSGDPVWKAEIAEKINRHISEWKDQFTKALATLRTNSPIPHHFVVYASEGSAFIAKLLDGEQTIAYAGNHAEKIELTKIDTPYTAYATTGEAATPIAVVESMTLMQ